eukprot:3446946-Alexandrium_andersonii.AAC.1
MAVPARPTGQPALSAAPNRRTSETPIPQLHAQEAPRFVRGLLRLAVQQGGVRLSPIRSHREGRLARCARDRRPSGWIFGPEITLTSR